MQKSLYIIERALKSLYRTEGVILNSLLLLILTIFTFLSFDGFLFFNHWIQWIKNDALKKEGDVQGIVPVVEKLELFSGSTLILFVLLLIVTSSYLRRMMVQYFKIQQKEYFIMTFIGESTIVLSVEYALQGSFMAMSLFALGDVLASFIFFNRLSAITNIEPFSEVIDGFSSNQFIQILLVVGVSLYVFIRLFFYTKRQLTLFLRKVRKHANCLW